MVLSVFLRNAEWMNGQEWMASRVTALKVIALGSELAFLWLQSLKTIPPQWPSEDGAGMAISESPGQVFGKNIGSQEPPTSNKLDHLVDWVRRERKGVRIPVCLFNPSWACTSKNLSSEIIHRYTWMWSIDFLAILFKIKRKKLEATYIFIRKGEWWPN